MRRPWRTADSLSNNGNQDALCAILTATDPDSYTVYDVRAVKSLKSPCVNLYREDESMGEWLTYLNTCRRIARETNQPLRTVDRALWAANGRCPLGSADRTDVQAS